MKEMKEDVVFHEDRMRNENSINATSQLVKYGGRVKYVPVHNYFRDKDGFLQIISIHNGRTTHKDKDHLTVDGNARLDPLYRKYIFKEVLCDMD